MRNQRQYFRLRLPGDAALPYTTSCGVFQVTEISERGMRIICEEDTCPVAIQQHMSGTLELHDGTTLHITGIAGRRDNQELIILELEGFPFSAMMDEQRYMAKEYPHLDLSGAAQLESVSDPPSHAEDSAG